MVHAIQRQLLNDQSGYAGCKMNIIHFLVCAVLMVEFGTSAMSLNVIKEPYV
jgi:hypothetical protein